MLSDLSGYLDQRIPGATLAITPLPQCRDLELYLLAADYPQHSLSAEQATQLMDNPPYWAFCWASGQVLAAHILSKPELVAGRVVVDFGAGSGVVAIAAALAGAKQAIACDTDADAREISLINAQHNKVNIDVVGEIEPFVGLENNLITVADVFYDRENLPLLDQFNSGFSQVLVADSRLKGRPLSGLALIEQVTSHTVPDLNESSDFNSVAIYQTDEFAS